MPLHCKHIETFWSSTAQIMRRRWRNKATYPTLCPSVQEAGIAPLSKQVAKCQDTSYEQDRQTAMSAFSSVYLFLHIFRGQNSPCTIYGRMGLWGKVGSVICIVHHVRWSVKSKGRERNHPEAVLFLETVSFIFCLTLHKKHLILLLRRHGHSNRNSGRHSR